MQHTAMDMRRCGKQSSPAKTCRCPRSTVSRANLHRSGPSSTAQQNHKASSSQTVFRSHLTCPSQRLRCQASTTEQTVALPDTEADARSTDAPEAAAAGPAPESGNGHADPGRRREFGDFREIVENPPISVGDTVTGRVVWSGTRGSKIVLDIDNRIRGFLPVSHTPLQLRDHMDRQYELQMFANLRREYEVMQMPEEVEVNGRGPLISAKFPDMNIFWKRCHQIAELSSQNGEFLRLRINSANRGGLIAMVGSMVVFVPFSRIPKPPGARLTQEDLEREWIGKEVDVTIESVEPENNKVVGSISTANQIKLMRQIQVGALLWTRVHSIQSFGVFLNIENTSVNGLLHVSNMSATRVDTPESLFEHGERVRALIVGIEDEKRISFSTAELEQEDGAMFHDKEHVYKNADPIAVEYQRLYQEAAAAGQVSGSEFTPGKRQRKQQRREAAGFDSYDDNHMGADGGLVPEDDFWN